jgi:uncharacterized phage protein (TIGR01671 family)
MREIKFRAWYDGTREQIYPGMYLVRAIQFESKICFVARASVFAQEVFSLDQVVLMQFTGLHDKNSKEIWEGDIVTWTWLHSVMHGVVKWDNKRSCFYAGDREGHLLSYVEVIGNIYENPELLNPDATLTRDAENG